LLDLSVGDKASDVALAAAGEISDEKTRQAELFSSADCG